MLNRYLSSLPLIISALLAGCGTVDSKQDVLEIEPAAIEQPAPDRPFPTDTLYELLVGEFAGARNQPDIALKSYVTQALETRDAGITARAANIAVYLRALPELVQMTELWIQLEPENLQARQLAALSLVQTGRHIDAFPHAEYALDHGNDESLIMLASYNENRSPATRQQLLKLYSDLEQRLPESASVSLGKALILQQLGQFDEALTNARAALKKNPENAKLALIIAQLHHQKGDRPSALSLLEKSLKKHPESKQLRMQYSRFLTIDNPEAAYQQLEILAEQHPQDLELNLALALASKQKGDTDRAREIFTRLTGYSLTAANAHFQLGIMAEEEGEIELAVAHYRQVRQGTQLVEAAAHASHLMAQQGELEIAQLYLQQLRLEQPASAILLYQVESELLLEQQQLKDAHRILSAALDQHPNNLSLLYARSMVSERNNDFPGSERDLRTILMQDEDNAMALNALGYTMTLHTNRYQEAHQLITRALEIEPNDPAIIDSLGWVLFHMGKHQEAIHYLQQAMSQHPDPEIAAHLGEALWVTGKTDEAMSIWQSILENDPANTMILETIQRLQATP